jgi:hypothetical protein
MKKYRRVNMLKETIKSSFTSATNAIHGFVYIVILYLILDKPASKTSYLMKLMSKKLKKTCSIKDIRNVLGAAGLLKRIKVATS